MGVRRVRFATSHTYNHALRSLAARRELALSGFAVDQILAGRGQSIGGPRARRSLLLANDEQQIDALLTGISESLRCQHHRCGEALRVTRAAPIKSATIQSRCDERRDRVEVRREGDAAAA